MLLMHACSPWYWTCNALLCLWFDFTCDKKLHWCHCCMLWLAIIMESIIVIADGDPGCGYDYCCCLRIWWIPRSMLMPVSILRLLFWSDTAYQIDIWDPSCHRKFFWCPWCTYVEHSLIHIMYNICTTTKRGSDVKHISCHWSWDLWP